MENELFFRLVDDLARKIEALAEEAHEAKLEIGEIKAKLFNGLSDTTKDTYAKVLVLEQKQHNNDLALKEIQHSWIEKFTAHDTKERMYHRAVTAIMAFLVTIFSSIIVFELENNSRGKISSLESSIENIIEGKASITKKQSGDNNR